jgi:glycosyltransferase involved in cell wall biosynthesis
MATVTFSIIMATYNRGDVIAYAIRSVLWQTERDWELLVVGDACTDETESVVHSFQDPRIRFLNLPQRCGDQSAATNAALQIAQGKYLSFLNHDDLWFPDHLRLSKAELEANACDLVFAMQFDLDPDGTVRLSLVYPEGFQPFLPPNISTWSCRREWALVQEPMRSFKEIYTYPSIDWLLRAKKKGGRFRCTRAVTVFIITTITRENTYLKRDDREHAKSLIAMQEPSIREKLLTEAFLHTKPTHLPGYSTKRLLRSLSLRVLKKLLLRMRCNPIAWSLYLKSPKKWGLFPRKGSLGLKLKKCRGL